MGSGNLAGTRHSTFDARIQIEYVNFQTLSYTISNISKVRLTFEQWLDGGSYSAPFVIVSHKIKRRCEHADREVAKAHL
jgi:hypothetical protein